MHDVLLWELLTASQWDLKKIKPLLAYTARLPVAERLPFFGFAEPLLEVADPEIKANALLLLSEAGGGPSLQVLSEHLNAPEPEVQKAAVQALRRTALRVDSSLWALPVFHSEKKVRQVALDLAVNKPLSIDRLLIYLLKSPDHQTRVKSSLVQAGLNEKIHLEQIQLALKLRQEDGLSAEVTEKILKNFFKNQKAWSELVLLSKRKQKEAEQVISQSTTPAGPTRSSKSGQDLLDTALELLWDVKTQKDSYEPFLFTIPMDIPIKPQGMILVSALLLKGYQSGTWPSWAAQTCLVCFPQLFFCPFIPETSKVQTLDDIHQYMTSLPKQDKNTLKHILSLPLFYHASGEVNLWRAKAILTYPTQGNPYELAKSVYGIEALVLGVKKDFASGAAFFALPDIRKEDVQDFFEAAKKSKTGDRVFLISFLLSTGLFGENTILDALDPEGCLAFLPNFCLTLKDCGLKRESKKRA